MANSNWPKLILTLSIVTILLTPIDGTTNQRKLDDTTLPLTPDTSIKCGCSTCTPCILKSPPPPSPCPPPPAEVLPPPPPPPPPKKPPTPGKDCPPPPMIPFPPSIFVPGPPGNLYPIDNFYSGSYRRTSRASLVAMMCGLVGVMIAFFW